MILKRMVMALTCPYVSVAMPAASRCETSLTHRIWPGEGSTVQWTWAPPAPGSLKALLLPPLFYQSTKRGNARGTSEVRRGTSSIHFHCPVPGRPVIFGMENQNCLQWGRSNLLNPSESPKIRLLNRDFGNILSIFPSKNSKHRVH